MPYFTLDHMRAALKYMADHTHPAIMAVLALARAGAKRSDDPANTILCGSTIERALMESYFRPIGGPDGRPYYFPFGPQQQHQSRWRNTKYASSSLQRQRRERRAIFLQEKDKSQRWCFTSDAINQMSHEPTRTLGDTPLVVAYLAVWCYRKNEVGSWTEVLETFMNEFHLADLGFIPELVSDNIPDDLLAMPLAAEPLDDIALRELLQTFQPPHSSAESEDVPYEAEGESEEEPVPASERIVKAAEAPGDWSIGCQAIGDQCDLLGIEEAATRAFAALAAGRHVIFTGPPGTGKTSLAECIAKSAGFPSWTVPATDQWTTFETIGGYFPMPQDGGTADHLDFQPGAVVDSIEKGQCLIIDEINRADIDKAFGELFTLLSGNKVTLPYRRRSGGTFRRVRLQMGTEAAAEEDVDLILVPSWWRIIGSMNDADKASLKRLSMAFVRRFAFIPIDLPSPDIYKQIICTSIERTSAARAGMRDMARLAEKLIDLFADQRKGFGEIGLPLGPAFPRAIIQHADSEWKLDPNRSIEQVLCAGLELYAMPQFQGRSELHEPCTELLQAYFSPATRDIIERHLAVWTGYVPR